MKKQVAVTGAVVSTGLFVLVLFSLDAMSRKSGGVPSLSSRDDTSDDETVNVNNGRVSDGGDFPIGSDGYSKLNILTDRCVGCGRCTMIDPEHFRISVSDRKAEVVTQENVDSENVVRAISMCQYNAIEMS